MAIVRFPVPGPGPNGPATKTHPDPGSAPWVDVDIAYCGAAKMISDARFSV